MKPHHELVERFRRDLRPLARDPARLALAVSGGPDSLALLFLAQAALPHKIAAATVDHRLRPESAREAERVAAICKDIHVPHVTLEADVDTGSASLQQQARLARYRALSQWMGRERIYLLATAHHLDDQAETVLMRLLRGSGLSGLAGIPAKGPLPYGNAGQKVIRPLLGWRRSELAELVAEEGVEPTDDPTNRDRRFGRARLRRLMARTPWLDPEPLAKSAAALHQAERALIWAADRLWRERTARNGSSMTLDARELPPELVRRLLVRALRTIRPAASPRGEEIERLMRKLKRGDKATLAGVICEGGEKWRFSLEPGRSRSTDRS
ncbi:MAG: tRNA lysidine(34) synthetase TilS [Sphingomonadaceae bacterium]